jgi:Trk K+ transport system NAD-binding subunit
MAFRSRRTVSYLALVVVVTVGLTLVYNTGMAVWEGESQPLYRSLEIVVQSFTTTGYGEDAGWESLQMNLLVIVLQLTGIGLILTAVDVFAVPWLRDALASTVPESALDAEGHVLVCGFTPRTDAFVGELEARDRDYVLVEPDAETAADCHDEGYRVVHGDPESTPVLSNVRVRDADAVVADVADDRNASITLAVKEASPETRVVTVVENPDLEQYHRVAGADVALSPRRLLGQRLAGEVPTAVTADIEAGVEIGEDLELVEITIEAGSDLCQQTFAEAALGERFGVTVVGAWFGTDFETGVEPTTELTAGARLLVAGDPEQLERLQSVTTSTVRDFGPQEVIVAGFGDSGRAAYDALSDTNSRLTVLDIEDGDGVDVVGDAREPAALEAAGIRGASALLVTLADDTTAIFATLIARELNPEIEIAVRANERDDVTKLYRAGADSVESLARISGRMLTETVFEGEEVLVYDKQVRVVRVPAPGLEGRTLADAAVRTKTGCTVIAVVRDEDLIADIDPATFEIEPGDEVVIAGTDEDVTRFDRLFGEEN